MEKNKSGMENITLGYKDNTYPSFETKGEKERIC
tara:strand:+ start:631 stop:732 length:102 start_codon:yes stop_codon:yes gene_type:complete